MKNKILCLSLLLLSTITCIDDIFAAVKIKKMLSFKQLPISNNRFTPMSPKTYDAMVKKLYALAGYSNNWETKEDVTIRNRIVMLSALYECVKFLGLKKYYYDGGGSVFSMDYSWPNIRRIAERLIEEPAKAILPKTFQSLEYEKTVALKKIEENRAALIELLKKIKEIEVGINDGNRQVVDISDEQIDYFITNLCFGKNAVFSVELTEDENEPRLLCERLKVMLKNYSGFQRICSILTMRLINTIMARGGKKEASIKKAKHDEGNAYSFDSDTLFLTADAINGSYCENCYGTDTNKDSSDTVYHEMTHFFHNMVNGRLSDNSQEISSGQALTPLIMYNICNSNLSLVDLFFPALTTSKMKPIVDKIENELKEKADSLKLKENAIYQIYIAVVNNGFGNL
ncbi:MAG: hypothetical protein LBT67_03090, partial [Holosporaceae bacterium]|nr:hypothetical protein [Holosporaceae bacterium]